ncbi:MAG TPA: nitroreductase family protein [Treponemataceae bacterium]|nr:nitroreductase family protein [Treponemataceae bacterium]HPS44842.1 nitroreductase family protein [Treponemataceae bacterium]
MNETLQTIGKLRSIHGGFSSKRIPDGDVQAILGAAVRAANASARQSYSMIVLDDKDAMRRVFGYAGDRAIVFCVDFTRLSALSERLGHAKYAVDFFDFLTGAIDTSFAAQTACVAARSLGIDSLFTNGLHRTPLDKVYAELGLPERFCFPLIALVLGYPAEDPRFQKGRLSGKGIVHLGRYCALTEGETDAIVREYDDREAHLGLVNDWKEKGFAHYLDWYFKEWEGPTPTEKIAELVDRLKKSGFMD